MKGIKSAYEEHHRLTISDEALEAAARLSARYVADRFLPDKAIDVLDETGSRMRLTNIVIPQEIRQLEADIEKIRQEVVV